jgi:probable phosphoglycerate mutase
VQREVERPDDPDDPERVKTLLARCPRRRQRELVADQSNRAVDLLTEERDLARLGRDARERERDEARETYQREADKWRFVAPEGESYESLAERVSVWANAVTTDTVVVSHGGVARALMRILCDVAVEKASMADIWQGRVLVFEAGRYSWV